MGDKIKLQDGLAQWSIILIVVSSTCTVVNCSYCGLITSNGQIKMTLQKSKII